jgi:DNA helicase-2/ATP-dependent DNA helicase PcrA
MANGYRPTPEQQAILDHDHRRHGRVLAGPGTGKSATVVALLTRLLAEDDPPQIRLLTFTRAATAELADKIEEHPDAAVERPSTIHSFAISALLRNPGAADFESPLRIADEWEMDCIVHADLARLAGTTPSVVKRQLIPEMAANWESLERHEDPRVDEHLRNRFLGAWDEHRRVYGYTLLAELPDLLRRALESHDDLEGLDYELMVVDEYQDLNACDLRVLQLLAERGMAVLGVGDDEQSIYGFRRAAPEGILRFLDDYPGAADYVLSVSHRCGSDIIAWARHVIESDPRRAAGRPRLQAPDGAPAGEAALLSFPSQVTEARGVAALIESLIDQEGLQPSDILVMFRGDHNAGFSGPIKRCLQERGIPFEDPAWVKTLLAQADNRLVLLVLRLLADRTDSLAWRGLLVLEAGVGPGFAAALYEQARSAGTTFARTLLDGLEEEYPTAPAASRGRASDLVRRVLEWLDRQEIPDEPGVEQWGAWVAERFDEDPLAPLSDELRQLLADVDTVAETGLDLGRYLSQLQPLARDLAQAQAGGVRFMSMNSSKGLTVEASIVVGAEEGVVPRPDADVDEERRLLYVAMTRARRFNFVTWAGRRTGPTARAGAPRVRERRTESRFLRNGPVRTQDGAAFLRARWGRDIAA